MDIKTILINYMVVDFICIIFSFIMWKNYKNKYDGLQYWMLTMILQFFGVLFYITRGIVPDFISYVVSNTMIVSGLLLILIGYQKFLNLYKSRFYYYLLIFIFVVLFYYFSFIKPYLIMREIILSVTTIIFAICNYRFICKYTPKLYKKISNFIANSMLLYIEISILRIIYILFRGNITNDFFKSDKLTPIFLMLYMASNLVVMISIIMTVIKRLILEVTQKESKFNAIFQLSPYAINLTEIENGNILEINKEFEILSGYLKEEIIGKKITELKFWNNILERDEVIKELINKKKL